MVIQCRKTQEVGPLKDPAPFWKVKPLAAMTDTEWESLCDGCGRCCLVKLEEDLEDAEAERPKRGAAAIAALTPLAVAERGPGTPNPRIFYTDVRCRLLDGDSCRCRDYENRMATVHDCVRLTREAVAEIGWLPPTCGYRLLSEGHDLYWWHPLVSGDPESVHAAGVSVRGRAPYGENDLSADDAQDRIVTWPVRVPKAARRKVERRKP